MPFALVVIGLIMIVTGARNTYQDFGNRLIGEFTGQNNFTYWIASIGAVGALGYVKSLETFSRTFMALIIIVIFLSNGGFFQKFTSALQQGPITPTPNTNTTGNPASVTTTQPSVGNTTATSIFTDLNNWLGNQAAQGQQQVTNAVGQHFGMFINGLKTLFGF